MWKKSRLEICDFDYFWINLKAQDTWWFEALLRLEDDLVCEASLMHSKDTQQSFLFYISPLHRVMLRDFFF